MDAQPTVDRLRQILDAEEASEDLTAIPADIYTRLGTYAQKLRAASVPNADDLPARLTRKQLWLLEVMTKRLLQARMAKASKGQTMNLLPEERYLDDMLRGLTEEEGRFARAVGDGQPSFFALLQRRQAQKMVTVRISKKLGEIMGADLKRYGPFEANDIARLPAANAQAMVASKQALPVSGND